MPAVAETARASEGGRVSLSFFQKLGGGDARGTGRQRRLTMIVVKKGRGYAPRVVEQLSGAQLAYKTHAGRSA